MKNNVLKKAAIHAAKMVKSIAVFSANSASIMGSYQPTEPKEMKKFKK